MLHVSVATRPAPGRDNEDHVVVGREFVVVLDGVTQLPELDTGCVHSPVWLVRTLGSALGTHLERDRSETLSTVLRASIDDVRSAHQDSCDLDNANSPSSTVVIARGRDALVDYLVLCDSSIVVDVLSGPNEITDDRTEHLPAYDRENVARLRNTDEGFWVASTAAEAADHAITGSIPIGNLRRALLCTDGISRLVRWFGYSWTQVLDLADTAGPEAVIDAVRTAERSRIAAAGRTKAHDDATLAVVTFDDG